MHNKHKQATIIACRDNHCCKFTFSCCPILHNLCICCNVPCIFVSSAQCVFVYSAHCVFVAVSIVYLCSAHCVFVSSAQCVFVAHVHSYAHLHCIPYHLEESFLIVRKQSVFREHLFSIFDPTYRYEIYLMNKNL